MQNHNQRPDNIEKAARRRVVGNAVAVSALVTTALYWKKPIIESVLLPAHAQTSATPSTTEGSGLLMAAATENRIPSGGSPVLSISQVSFVGCTAGPAVFSAVANMSPGGTVNLGSLSVASVVPGVVYTLNVAPSIVAAVAAVNTITTTTATSAGSTSQTTSAGNVTVILMGSTLSPVCP